MSVQSANPIFSMRQLLDSDFQTWSYGEDLAKADPFQMVYITGFSDDKKKVNIKVLDWKNDKCIDPQFARKLVADRSIAGLQYKGNKVVFYASEQQENKFKHKNNKYKVVCEGKNSDIKTFKPKQTSFLNETKFSESAIMFKQFCISQGKV